MPVFDHFWWLCGGSKLAQRRGVGVGLPLCQDILSTVTLVYPDSDYRHISLFLHHPKVKLLMDLNSRYFNRYYFREKFRYHPSMGNREERSPWFITDLGL